MDIYSTNEPQGAFHQRVSFCLDLYNQSVRVCAKFLKLLVQIFKIENLVSKLLFFFLFFLFGTKGILEFLGPKNERTILNPETLDVKA